MVKIDDRDPIKLPYLKCAKIGCIAETPVENHIFEEIKEGSKIVYLGVDVRGKALKIPLPLAGFKQALGGPSRSIAKFLEDTKKVEAAGKEQRQASGGEGHYLDVEPSAITPQTSAPSAWYKLCADTVMYNKHYEALYDVTQTTLVFSRRG